MYDGGKLRSGGMQNTKKLSLYGFCWLTGMSALLSVQCYLSLSFLLWLQSVTDSGAALLSLHHGWDGGEIWLCHRPRRHLHRRVRPAARWQRESPETAVPGPPELQGRSHWGDQESPGRGNMTGGMDVLIHTFLEKKCLHILNNIQFIQRVL